MVLILPTKLLQLIESEWSCRKTQLQQLGLYYNQHYPSPAVLVAYGHDDTDKLATISAFLEATGTDHAIVKTSECLSQRHLLSKIFSTVIQRLGLLESSKDDRYDRLDNLNALLVNLQRLLEGRKEKIVLVIDGVDKQRGSSHTLLPSLARLGDAIPGLSVLLTTSSPRLSRLQRSGVLYIHFPPYSRSEAIRVVSTTPPALQPTSLPEYFPRVSTSALTNIYTSFVTAVYDTLTTHTSTSIPALRRTCERLWPSFIWPMLSGEPLRNQKAPSQSTLTPTPMWDFARLIIKNRSLFQTQGEKALLPQLVSKGNETWTFADLMKRYEDQNKAPTASGAGAADERLSQAVPIGSTSILTTTTPSTPLLKFFPTLLLLSAYLASHTTPKHDIILFSRLSSSSSHKRKYLASALQKNRVRKVSSTTSGSKSRARKGDVDHPSSSLLPTTTATIPSEKKRSRAVTASDMTMGAEKPHRSTRLQFEKTSSIPKPFSLERLIAILRAIHPEALFSRKRGIADKVYVELVELERLRLVIRLGTAAASSSSSAAAATTTTTPTTTATDPSATATEAKHKHNDEAAVLEEKWRVNVTRPVIIQMGTKYNIGVDGWEID